MSDGQQLVKDQDKLLDNNLDTEQRNMLLARLFSCWQDAWPVVWSIASCVSVSS